MGKKKRMFIDKVVGKKVNTCDVCGEALKQVKVLEAHDQSESTYRYSKNMIAVCACNRDKVFH